MKLSVIAAVLAAAALPVLAQNTAAPAEPRQARVEVSDPATNGATKQKASKPAKSSKSTKTAKKSSKKKSSKKKQQTVG